MGEKTAGQEAGAVGSFILKGAFCPCEGKKGKEGVVMMGWKGN